MTLDMGNNHKHSLWADGVGYILKCNTCVGTGTSLKNKLICEITVAVFFTDDYIAVNTHIFIKMM